METKIFKEMILVIRVEKERRELLLKGEDSDFAYDQRLFIDEPFVNELCLMLLVTLRHQVERELVGLSARATNDGKEISHRQYQEEIKRLQKGYKLDWEKISHRLKLKSCKGYKFMEVLRLIANLYKHDLSRTPNKDLLKLIGLETKRKCAPLPESDLLQKGLAVFIGLSDDADYCIIANLFVEIASEFLADVQKKTNVSPVKRDSISFTIVY